MPKNQDTTTKFKVDISELKSQFAEAQRQIRLANSEFKAATAGMDNWSKSADGLSAKINQLNSVLDSEKAKLSSLQAQYALVAKEQGENSKGAQELLIKINNQKAAIGKTEASLAKYDQQLDDVKKGMSDVDDETDSMNDSLKDVEKAADKAGDGFTVMKGAIASLIADGLKALANAAVDSMKTLVLETDEAYDNFQAQTGASTKEMKEFEKQINELYKGNYGESVQDVANAMAEVKQQTKETDPTKLKELTENGLALRDVFDMDIKESMRAVNMLMEQFGISGDEAYNLIVQGAQNGLNKNDDLLDTINEYGVHYKQLGYDADEFFNSLANGTEAGTFSVDKLGDAMKEFGIRTKDTATTTQEGFELLGYSSEASGEKITKTKDEIAKLEKNLQYAKMEQEGFNSKTSELTRMKNADKIKEYSDKLSEAKENLKGMTSESKNSSSSVKDLQERFAAGGETAQQATKEVLEKLMAMDDKVKQNQIGVDLFGTMWEDLGIEGVKALMNTNGKLDMTKKSMEELKKVRYDNVKSQFASIGRTLQMDFILPLAEKAIPYVQKFADYIINNMDQVIAVVKNVGIAVASIFVAAKLSAFTQAVIGMVGAFKTVTKAITAATAAQEALNLVQLANPIGIVVGAIGALVTATVLLNATNKKTVKNYGELSEAEKENKKSVDDLAKSYKEVKASRDESVSGAESQFAYYSQLKDELDSIVDKNGKVKKGQEDRAKFIVSTLNEALGSEIELSGNIVKNYENEKKALDKLLESKKAQIILQANEEAYTQAIKNKTQALNDYTTAQQNVDNTSKQLTSAQGELNTILSQSEQEWAKANGKTLEGRALQVEYAKALGEARKKVSDLTEKQKGQNDTLSKAEETWIGYNSMIKNYEGLSAAIISGDTEKINSALQNMTSNFITAENGNKKTLEKQVKTMRENYNNLKTAVEKGTPGVTKEMVKSAKNMVEQSEKELKKLEPKAKTTGAKSGKNAADGLKSKKKDAEKAGEEVSKEAKKGLEKGDAKAAGKKKSTEYKEGLELGKSAAGKTGKELGEKVKKELEGVKTKSSGEDFVQGLIDGMNSDSKNSLLTKSVKKVANKALKTMKDVLGIASPSKVTKSYGEFFDEGFINGINSKVEEVGEVAKKLVKKSIKPLLNANKKGTYEQAGEKVVNAFEKGITKEISSAENSVEKLVNKTVKKAKAKTNDDKTKKAFENLGKSMIDSFSSSYEKQADKMIEKATSKIEKLTSTMQEKYDDIINLRDGFEDRLNSTELFTRDSDGQMEFTDLFGETNKLNQLNANLTALKGKVSQQLLDEVVNMAPDDALEFTNRILSMTDEQIAAYNAAYVQKLQTAKGVAQNFYAEQINTLQTEYSAKVKSVMGSLSNSLEEIGENAIKGFLKGFNSKDKETTKAVKNLTKSLVKKLKKELGIKSPSRVMRDMIGRYIPAGIAVGIKKNTSAAVKAMSELADNIIAPMKSSLSNIDVQGVQNANRAIGRSTVENVTNVYNFNQTNNSPKALSRWDIYRQSKNLLKGAQYV